LLTTSCQPDWPVFHKKMDQPGRAGVLADPLLFLADMFGCSSTPLLVGIRNAEPCMASRSSRGFRERTSWRTRATFLAARVRVHSNAVRRPRQAGCGRSLRISLFSCRMGMWREAGWHPKCRLFAARVPSPCAGTILRLKRVITSTVLQVFAVALEQSWEPTRQLAAFGCRAAHSRRWLS